ncbi:TadE family protein [Microbacterium sp. NPDC096154]|uniref:TadE/TadG family type IV pilus assembly protein n=1 Tax=Microbacterium sp. NPDC096154 TaxID=3155549 RepID=UPI0033300277
MPRSRLCRDLLPRGRRDEEGSAALEFLVTGTVMLVPLVYLVLALAQIQAHALGVEAGARFAARAIASGPAAADPDAVLASVTREYGIGRFQVEVSCVPASATCPAPGATVVVDVTARVPLPLMPPVLGLDRLTSVPVQATSVQKVSRYWESR